MQSEELGALLHIDPPNPKQQQFLTATQRHVAYGGARGGGKSWAVRTKAVLLALRWPGIKILILRRSYRELMNNHVSFLRRQLHGIAVYHSTDKVFTFPGGSTIAMGYCACDGDLDQYQGAEYDVIFIDEAGQLMPEWIEQLNACVRGVNEFPKRAYYTLNPGGPAHGYFKRLFIDRQFREAERPEEYRFIQALVTDNTALLRSQPEYIAQLRTLPPHLRQMWLEGRWDVGAGQFFAEFRDDPAHYDDHLFTHVIEPFQIPAGWSVYRSYDFGYNKPFSCAWWAMDEDGVAYRFLELYGCTETPNEGVRWAPERQFREIGRIEREHPWLRGRNIRGVADPAIWDKSHGESIAETAGRCGVWFQKGDNQRIPGWMQMHYRMSFDGQGRAQLYVFKTCRAFIRTIPLLLYDSRRPEDLDTDLEDHVADESRYFCMMRPVAARPIEAPKPRLFDPLAEGTVPRRNAFGR